MVTQEKHAVFNLLISLTALVLFLTVMPFYGFQVATAGFSVLGIAGLGPFLFRRPPPEGVLSDERDKSIWLRSIQLTFGVCWLLFVGALLTIEFLSWNRAYIPAGVVPLGLWLGTTFLLICHSTVLLALYRQN